LSVTLTLLPTKGVHTNPHRMKLLDSHLPVCFVSKDATGGGLFAYRSERSRLQEMLSRLASSRAVSTLQGRAARYSDAAPDRWIVLKVDAAWHMQGGRVVSGRGPKWRRRKQSRQWATSLLAWNSTIVATSAATLESDQVMLCILE